MNANEVLEFAKQNNAVMVDLRFTDWPGTWQHCSFPINEIAEEHFEDGLGFDGSSIRGWQSIHESDMLMVPDSGTAFIDPFFKHPTLVLISDIVDPITKEPYSRDPRHIARKAENYLRQSGIGDTAYFAAGRSSFLDEGIFLYGVNATTGEKVCETVVRSESPKPQLGKDAPAKAKSSAPKGALPDILISNGNVIVMQGRAFSPDLKDGGRAKVLSVPYGFINDGWMHRTNWSLGGGGASSRRCCAPWSTG